MTTSGCGLKNESRFIARMQMRPSGDRTCGDWPQQKIDRQRMRDRKTHRWLQHGIRDAENLRGDADRLHASVTTLCASWNNRTQSPGTASLPAMPTTAPER